MPQSKRTTQSKVIFDVSKKESCIPNQGYKKFIRKLKQTYQVSSASSQLTLNKEEVNTSISEAKLVVFGGPKQPFTESEF